MIHLNKQEAAIGFIYAAAWTAFLGWLGLLTAALCAFLWALSGADGQPKAWRRIACPTALCGHLFLIHGDARLLVCILGHVGILSIGYGIPSTQPADKGSALGSFFWSLFIHTPLSMKQTEIVTDMAVRGSLCFFLALALWPLAFISVQAYLYSSFVLIFCTLIAVCTVEGTF